MREGTAGRGRASGRCWRRGRGCPSSRCGTTRRPAGGTTMRSCRATLKRSVLLKRLRQRLLASSPRVAIQLAPFVSALTHDCPAQAYKNLHIDYNAFDYKNTPVPQSKAYNAWLKKQLAAGYPVVWMILWSLQSYPIYDLTPPAGMYGHVEPVIGISSDHPLDDETVYENDRVLHYDDAGLRTISRTFDSLPARRWDGPGHPVLCQGWYSYCIGYPYGFGWAIKGFTDAKEDVAMAASLSISPSRSEPDTRAGQKPAPITGTLTATGLTSGAKYDIYRWDSAATAFTYTDAYKKTSFTAAEATYQYADPDTFMSNSATYYRVLPAQQ
eukprot:TRINITY_DN6473_c0_g1_i1.p1 TRINITY_DN6473_c0_g1~~TRINITY_DN6473_c0_g1_i1.p1  ORF type:complete len:327 (+),score=45.49 TRINITY_DN6473_c0_g1_i1:219-1199(+)